MALYGDLLILLLFYVHIYIIPYVKVLNYLHFSYILFGSIIYL